MRSRGSGWSEITPLRTVGGLATCGQTIQQKAPTPYHRSLCLLVVPDVALQVACTVRFVHFSGPSFG